LAAKCNVEYYRCEIEDNSEGFDKINELKKVVTKTVVSGKNAPRKYPKITPAKPKRLIKELLKDPKEVKKIPKLSTILELKLKRLETVYAVDVTDTC
jgi:hypothetical protein